MKRVFKLDHTLLHIIKGPKVIVGEPRRTIMIAPFSTQITSPVFRSLLTPELNKLSGMFKERGYELRIAGGAVRDILMNIPPVDIDLATTATPTEMKNLFSEKQIRMINAAGEKHGTITARIDDRENFEITTLRIDKVTDGRHAEVEFTQDWVLDAERRDLTINSMFLDLDGNLFDHCHGELDLRNRLIRFVGDPDKRIQEDYLRILRYFRFFGRISNTPNDHNNANLEAIARNMNGMERISGERIWTELRRIVVGRFADSVMTRMTEIGLAPYLGLPAKPNVVEMELVWKRCHDFDPKPMTIIAALMHSEEDIEKMDERLKLANEECGLGFFIIRNRSNSQLLEFCRIHPDADPLTPYKQLLAEEMLNASPTVAKNRCLELLKYRGDSVLLQSMVAWELPKFPVHGSRILEKGVAPGRKTGQVLDQLRKVWIKSDFQKTEEVLLDVDLPVILHNITHHRVEREVNKKAKRERNSKL